VALEVLGRQCPDILKLVDSMDQRAIHHPRTSRHRTYDVEEQDQAELSTIMSEYSSESIPW
jgi:hypothetical protein